MPASVMVPKRNTMKTISMVEEVKGDRKDIVKYVKWSEENMSR